MTQIFVISHRPLPLKLKEPLTPLYVGLGATKHSQIDLDDTTGDSISVMNPYFCELTGLYWVWKNWMPKLKETELIGFCHYRRFFSPNGKIEKYEEIENLETDKLLLKLQESPNDVVLSEQISFPIRQHWFSLSKKLRKIKLPWKKLSLLEQYGLEHEPSDLLLAMDLLPNQHRLNFEQYMHGGQFAPYNMFITSAEIANHYFEILFPWLLELQQKMDMTNRSPYQARAIGFIAERFCSYYFSTYHRPVFVPVSFIKQ